MELKHFEIFKKQGILRIYRKNVFFPQFLGPYDWMKKQLSKRLGIRMYKSHTPIWVWISPKPNLSHGGHLPKGTAGVCLTLELDLNRLLMSDFDAWHCVLNNWPVLLSGKEERHYQRLNKRAKYWSRIFDLPLLRKSTYWRKSTYIQAVTDHVKFTQVKEVRYFTAR